jgi:choline dehydrogenase-like flavoprotein
MPNIGVQIERYIRKLDDVERVARAFRYMDRDRLKPGRRGTEEVFSGQFYIRAEQRPDPENRVSLDRDRDALGMQRVKLRWHLAREDSYNFHKIMKVIGTELLRLSSGRVRLFVTDKKPWQEVYGGAHHMGTTRMSDAPQRGVVDSQCRMHEVHNLYIASSSVFPTSGFANPTLTIVALAARLADHLKAQVRTT